MGGEHEIVPDHPRRGPRVTAREWTILLAISFALLSALGYAWLREPDVPTLPSVRLPPQAPANRMAVIQSRTATEAAPMKLVLGGDRYVLHYVAIPDASRIPVQEGGAGVYWADFDRGHASGDCATAAVIVLKGDLSLRVNDIARDDSLHARIVQSGPAVNAYFDYAVSPRGPPTNARFRDGMRLPRLEKTIYVIGTMTAIDIGEAHDESKREIDVIDLAPGQDVIDAYERRMRDWRIETGTTSDEAARAKDPRDRDPSELSHPIEIR